MNERASIFVSHRVSTHRKAAERIKTVLESRTERLDGRLVVLKADHTPVPEIVGGLEFLELLRKDHERIAQLRSECLEDVVSEETAMRALPTNTAT